MTMNSPRGTKRPENRKQAIAILEKADQARDFIPYPTVVETTHRGERNWDIFSRLLKDRIVFKIKSRCCSPAESGRRCHLHAARG